MIYILNSDKGLKEMMSDAACIVTYNYVKGLRVEYIFFNLKNIIMEYIFRKMKEAIMWTAYLISNRPKNSQNIAYMQGGRRQRKRRK